MTRTEATNPLQAFGFSFERGGVHTSRTMMLDELRTLLSTVADQEAAKADYLEAIQTANCLGKRSGKTRLLTFRHLADLYGLDPNLLLFRALRFLWNRDEAGQPLLALLCAYARDPILRGTAPLILKKTPGSHVTREEVETHIDQQEPGRFSAATLKSTAQNINSTWTKAGLLTGRARKFRSQPTATAGAVAYALLLAHVTGQRGEHLFSNEYMALLDCSHEQALTLAEDASRRGWIVLKRIGKVIEVQFPALLTAEDQDRLREQN